MVRHAPIHRRSGHSDIAICCGRNVRGSSPSTSVVPLSNQVTTLNHKRFKGFKMFSDGHLRPLQQGSPYVFVTEAGTPVTTSWFLRMIQRTGRAARLPLPIHPHMLRHSTGYKLANDGQDTRSLAHYLGHRNLQSTARYTALAQDRFAKFWKD